MQPPVIIFFSFNQLPLWCIFLARHKYELNHNIKSQELKILQSLQNLKGPLACCCCSWSTCPHNLFSTIDLKAAWTFEANQTWLNSSPGEMDSNMAWHFPVQRHLIQITSYIPTSAGVSEQGMYKTVLELGTFIWMDRFQMVCIILVVLKWFFEVITS